MQNNYLFKVMAIAMIFLFKNAIGQTYYDMSSGNYTETFTSWTSPNTGSWTSVAINVTGSIPSATRITAPANPLIFSTGTSGGIQNGSTNIQFLATGATDNTSSVALDLNLNFTNRNAGILTFDAATVFNSTGNRAGTLRIYYSIDAGTNWAELGGNLPFLANNNVSGNAAISVSLPNSISNQSQVKLRFYYHNGGTLLPSPTGSRPKISIDNVLITSTTSSSTPSLSISDVTQTEGNSGTTNYNFTVSLSTPAPVGGVSFDIATADGTATIANGDYDSNSLTGQIIPEGSSSYNFTVVGNGDAIVEANETFNVNLSNIVGADAGDIQGTGTITNDDFGTTLISSIQGTGLSAALTGTQTVQGIVTRAFFGPSSLNGFYVQEEDADNDGNPLTSEGIFVFNPPSQPAVGDKVTVTGTVIDFGTTAPLTEFSPTTSVVINSSGNPLPSVTNVSLPVANVSDLERYEGMLVNLTAATGNLVVTDNFELGRYGQIVLAANDPLTNAPGTDARIDQYTQFYPPSVSGNAAYQAAIAKRTIYIDDANTAQNIDPIKFGRGGSPLSASNTLRTGDEVANVTAVLDQRFEGYRLQIGNSSELNILPTNARPTTPGLTGNPTLVVGNMNVLNYFNGDGLGGGFPTPRGANTPAEFTRQRDKIINAIVNSGADILSLNEIENDGFGPESAIQDLVNGLNAATAPGTWAFVAAPVGTVLSTDQITCAMIYKPSKASPVGDIKALTTGEYVEVGRGAIAQTFKQNSNNATLTVVGSHFKSKGSLNAGLGNPDIGDGQGNNNGQRTRQAQELAAWLATDPTSSGDADILIVGDLNSYAKEDPITTLETAGYNTLIPATNTSYQFDGAHGALDHALGNNTLQAQVVSAKKWNINADEPVAIDYNIQLDNGTIIKTAGQIASLYNADQYRNSDHDPVLVGLILTCDDIAFNETVVSACNTFTWANNGQTYTESGTYIGSTLNCITEKLVLTITPSIENITNVSACDSYTWSVTGLTYNQSGTYTNITGCTTEILNLTLSEPITFSGITFLGFDCPPINQENIAGKFLITGLNPNSNFKLYGDYNGQNFPFLLGQFNSNANGEVEITSGYVINTIPLNYTLSIVKIVDTSNNCEKLLSENNSVSFTVAPLPLPIITNATICSNQTYMWEVNGITYNTSTTVTVIGENCTADKVLNLIVTPATINTTTISACDSYTWSVTGETYNASGTYIKVDGCHTEKLVLTITPSTINSTTISACDSYTWSVTGVTYNTSGTYTKITGCHTEKLVLTITPSSTNTANITACDSYTWAVNGQTYTNSGTYSFVNNCSTNILVLTIKSAGIITGPAMMCKGSSFIFNSSIAGGTWASSNNSVATVGNNGNNKGKVIAVNFGTTIISYTTNGCTSTYLVTVGDNLAPVISCPAAVTKALSGNNNCSTKINIAAPVVTDNCGGVTIGYALSGATSGTGSGAVGNKTFNVGVTNVVYTATDAAGNSATCATTVTVTNASCAAGGRASADNTEITENVKLIINVANNPTNDEFVINIFAPKAGDIQLNIIGLDGKNLQQLNVQPNTEVKIGKKLQAGLYILQAQQDKQVSRVKLLKN